ncbi:MAG: cell division protein ZipA [Pseudomonadota bacterium]
MTELRWILLAVGVVLLAGIYFFWNRKLSVKKPDFLKKSDQSSNRTEPSLGGEADFVDYLEGSEPKLQATQSQEETPAQAETPAKPQDDNTRIVSLHVAAGGAARFPGSQVVQVLHDNGLMHGKFGIFHRNVEGRSDQVAFSVANMLEPGTFDLGNIDNLSTPGVTFFMVLPSPVDGVRVFTDMLEVARSIALELGGDVLDQQGSSMSNQAAGHIREEIIAFQLEQKKQRA